MGADIIRAIGGGVELRREGRGPAILRRFLASDRGEERFPRHRDKHRQEDIPGQSGKPRQHTTPGPSAPTQAETQPTIRAQTLSTQTATLQAPPPPCAACDKT